MPLTRRYFCTRGTLLATAMTVPRWSLSQSSRPDVAVIDRERILVQAHKYALLAPNPITAHKAPNSPGTLNEFFSEDNGSWPDDNIPQTSADRQSALLSAPLFTAHREALQEMSLAVPALTAGCLLLRNTELATSQSFAAKAATHLHVWFVDPATRMSPDLKYGLIDPKRPSVSRFEGIIEAIQLVEVVQSVPILLSAAVIFPSDASAIFSWFAAYLNWLMTSRLAGLARDQRDHNGTSWLLQASALAVLSAANSAGNNTKASTAVTELRHRYKAVTLRSQIIPDGSFLQELSTPWPYRLSLFNLDMLAGVCLLLSTRFDSLWDFDLQDGPGMRVAVAHHYPFIQNRGSWPYPADASLFSKLPLRQPTLLFAGRAYDRPEYASVWRNLAADPADPVLLRTFPIRQPLLWMINLRMIPRS